MPACSYTWIGSSATVVAAALALAGCTSTSPQPDSWHSYGGPLDSPTLGQIIRYRSTVAEAMADARRAAEAAGFTLLTQSADRLSFRQQVRSAVLDLDIAFVAAEGGELRSFDVALHHREGPPLRRAMVNTLFTSITNALRDHVSITYYYIGDCYNPNPGEPAANH